MISTLLLLFFWCALAANAIASASAVTVDDLVANPPLVSIKPDGSWTPEEEYFLNNIYEAINSGDLNSASLFTKRVMQFKPNDNHVTQLAVYLNMSLRSWAEADGNLTKLIIASNGSKQSVLPLVRRAYIRTMLSRYAMAFKDYQTILAANPSAELQNYVKQQLSIIEPKMKATQQARDKAWKQLAPQMEALKQKNNWLNMETLLKEFIQNNPDDPQALLALGRTQLHLLKYDQARSLLLEALDSNPQKLEDEIKSTLVSVDNAVLAQKWQELSSMENNKDWTAAENLLSQMIQKSPNNPSLFIKRAELSLKSGEVLNTQIKNDLDSVLSSPYSTEKDREHVKNILSANQTADKKEAEQSLHMEAAGEAPLNWAEIVAFEKQLREKGDYGALAKYSSSLIKQYPKWSFGHSSRAYFYLSQQRLQEARADFANALTWEKESQARTIMQGEIAKLDLLIASKNFYNASAALQKEDTRKKTTDEIKHNAVSPANADSYLGAAQYHLSKNNYSGIRKELDQLHIFRLTAEQKALKNFLNAEVLWHSKHYAEAYDSYCRAIADLKDSFYQSEAYAKMADYNSRQKNITLAAEYIERSVRLNPGDSWRKIQAGDILAKNNQADKALNYFQQALTDKTIAAKDIYFYQFMAMNYFKNGDMDSFNRYMRLHIDAEAERLSLKKVKTEDDEKNIFLLKKSYTELSKKFNGSLFVFGNYYDNGDYLSSFYSEYKMHVGARHNIRGELYVKGSGNISSSFSGVYYDPWSGSNRSYVGKSHISDSFTAAVGGRYFPYPQYGFNIAVEQVFGLGKSAEDDTLLIANFYDNIGGGYEPVLNSWMFASLYSQLSYSLRHDDFRYGGEGRLGHSFRLNAFNELASVTPFWSVNASYAGKDVDSDSAWGLETGPGIMFSKWLAEHDPYKIPDSNINFTLQYRFSINHNNENSLGASMYYSF